MKKCKRCQQSKAVELYSLMSKAKDGLQSSCKSCAAIYRSSSKGRSGLLADMKKYHSKEECLNFEGLMIKRTGFDNLLNKNQPRYSASKKRFMFQ